MEERFKNHIQETDWLSETDKILVATSAGIDSTVLCHLLYRSEISFGIAHCNFQLRGEESEKDERFLKKLSEEFQVFFYAKKFETEKYAAEKKISIQMAARELRYEWLEEIRNAKDYLWVATAHHLDDSIETLLFNFAKGCGIRGLHGILPKNGKVIRPMLFTNKKEIAAFAKKESIPFREDASNAADKYLRNKIRHHIIPVFENINLAFQKNARETIERINEAEALMDFAIESIKKEIGKNIGEEIRIDSKKLLSYPAPSTLLFEMLRPFGFNNSQVKQILQAIDNQPGKLFFSESHRLLVDRNSLLIKWKENSKGVKLITAFNDEPIELPTGKIQFQKVENGSEPFSQNPNKAFFDFELLQWPITIRSWKPGDAFQPLGMKGQQKKLKKYFSDEKLSRFEKEETWIMESDGKICWIVGMRPDERFKVSNKTVHILVVEFLPTIFAAL